MTTNTALLLIGTLALAGAGCHDNKGTPTMQSTKPSPSKKSGHIAANGVSYYYEIHGKGEPLLLLHGGLMSIDMFGATIPRLAETRQVIAVDLHGHGRTALGARDISLIDQGDDMEVIIKQLGLTQVDALGYSFGAGVAFRFAVQHPSSVRRLVLVSAGFAQDGFFPEMLPMQAAVGAGMIDMMKQTPMYTTYAAVAPDPAAFPKLLDQMGALMRTPYNWRDDVKKLSMPTMLVFGDSDMFRPEHIVEFYQLLGGGLRDAGWQREHMSKNRLAILPDRTHYDMFASTDVATTALPFLDAGSGSKTSSDQAQARR
jgi:pimeloyl-ACP methyl ester carboxylesterase